MANEYQYLVLCLLLVHSSGLHASKDLAKPRTSHLANTHIVGGVYADIETLPYQLSVQYFLVPGCGGSIISADYALTAAHCNLLTGYMTNFITVTAGTSSLISGGEWHYVAKTFSHPAYSDDALEYDIAVFKMKNPFPVTDKIRPIPLPTQSEEEFLDFNELATVSGYGVAEVSQDILPIWLRKVDVPLVSRERCQNWYAQATKPLKITPRMICAGGMFEGDACKGDSGGPLVHKGHLIGVVSWGIGCDSFPGVYTNLLDSEIRSFVGSITDNK